MSDSVKFNFFYNGDNIHKVEIDQESRNNLDAEKAQRFEDLITSMINGISETLYRGSKKIFEFGGMPKNIRNIHLFKLNSITTTIDYLLYLEEEREKYGDNGIRDHAATIAKIGIGFAFSQLGYVIGGVAFGLPGAFAGAITMAITYDVKDIGGKTPSEWIGNVARAIIDAFTNGDFFENYEGLYKDEAALILGVGLQILLDAQDRGHILSMQNLDFINYVHGRVSEFRRSTAVANPRNANSNSASISPNKGPMGNSPSPNKGGSSASSSSNPTKGPTSGSSGSAANGNNAPTVRPSSANPSVSPAKAPITNSPTVRAQTGPNNQPIKSSTSGASRNANTPTTSQRASTNNPSVSPAKAPMNAPSSAPIRSSSTSTNSNNAPSFSPNLNSQQWNRPSSPKQNSQPQHPWTIPISPISSPLYPPSLNPFYQPSSTVQRAPISMPISSSGRVPNFAPSFRSAP